ncbi:MAG: SNF2-related protein [Kiritimatiellia bacterium]
MILHLKQSIHGFTLWGEIFGKKATEEECASAVAFLFVGWRHPVLEGRGVLQVLQGMARGLSSPTMVFGPTLQEASACFFLVARIVAAGRVVPVYEGGRASWRATVLPQGHRASLIQALVDLWMRTCGSTTLSRAQAARGAFYTAHDAWLAALRAPQATMTLQEATLEEELREWAAPAFVTGRAGLTLAPREENGKWVLTFGEMTPERLLQLGQAMGVAPLLMVPQPWDRAMLVRFLREAVPALRSAAFRVELPLALEATVPEAIETAVALDEDRVSVERKILFGGTELSLEEAEAVLAAGEALAFVAGAWRYVDLLALRQTLESVRGAEVLTKRSALPLLLTGALRVAPEAQAVQDFLREMTVPPTVELPLRSVLRPYQAQGVCWLMQAAAHGLGVCLADDMGLGKTIQTIALLLTRPGPALIVAPLTVLPVWEHELARFAPTLKVLRHEGVDRVQDSGFLRLAQLHDVVLVSYGMLWRDFVSLRRVSWRTLVLDEAQQIKNAVTRQAQAARSLSAEFRLALTGTPVENRLEDLWSILDFLNPGLFGVRRTFAQRYSDPRTLRRAVSHFLLRRLKTDPGILAELPPKILQEHYAPLTAEQSSAYDRALMTYERAAADGAANERAGLVLTLLMRLKQICDHPALAEPMDGNPLDAEASGKLLVLLPLLDEILERGESVLLFTQFARMGEALRGLLSERLGRAVPFLHGSLTPHARREQIAAFNEDPRPSILLLSLRTGAFGLTLTKANHVIHLDRWWNPAVEAQATDRAHRFGQNRTVVVHHLLCRGTLEDSIDRLLREKKELAETIIAPTPAALLARLPTAEVLNLLKRQS